MRISDWSSDVCSSDLQLLSSREFALIVCEYQLEGDRNGQQLLEDLRVNKKLAWSTAFMMVTGERSYGNVVAVAEFVRSAERSVGKECVSTCRYRWSRYN